MWWCSSSCISRLGGLFREDWSRKQANAKHSGGHFECVPSVCMFVRGGQTSAGDARHAGVCGPWGDQLWARGPGEWHVEHRSHLLLSVSWRKEMQLWILCGSESCNTGRPFRFLCGTERKWNARICLYLLFIYPFYMCWILWSNLKITKEKRMHCSPKLCNGLKRIDSILQINILHHLLVVLCYYSPQWKL